MPLDVLGAVLRYLISALEAHTKNDPRAGDEIIEEFIKNYTMVGLLPAPRRIITWSLEISTASESCERLYCWALIYVTSLPCSIAPREKVKMCKFADN